MGRAPLQSIVVITALLYLGAVAIFLVNERGVSSAGQSIAPVPAGHAAVSGIREPRLVIPRLDIDASIQTIGLASDGAIGIPTNYTDVGWFSGSAQPGRGNTIVVGHRDTRVFAPGVFRNLFLLSAGDDIYMYDENGAASHFRVMSQKTYYEDTDRLAEIVGSADRPRLTLITCEGIWNQSIRRYDQRLVVFADLVQ